MTKFTNARALRDPAALPSELRRVAGALSPEPRDILEHAADELEMLRELRRRDGEMARAPSVEGRERAVMDSLRRRGLADTPPSPARSAGPQPPPQTSGEEA